MLHIQGISAAQGWDYLTRQVMHGAEDYYASGDEAEGERPGRWAAESEALLGLAGEVTEDAFRELFSDHRHPTSGELLGRPRRVYKTIEQRVETAIAAAEKRGEVVGPEERAAIQRQVRRSDRVSVDAFDATFSPVKSVSVLWAALDAPGRLEVEEAQLSAVDAGLHVLTRRGAYTRTGHHSSQADANRTGRFEDTDGLVAAAFDHRMSRAGDPQLHTHAVILNLTQTSSDEAWRTLDSRALNRAKDHAAAAYELVLMHELTSRLGVIWRLRPDGKAYEIDGISEDTIAMFSSRRVAITERLAPLVEHFELVHGHAPSAYELTRMSEWATLQQRPNKAEPESTASALARWSADYERRTSEVLADLAERVTGRAPREGAALDRAEVERILVKAVDRTQQKRSTFGRPALAREIGFLLAGYIGSGQDRDEVIALIDRLTERALALSHVRPLRGAEPLELPAELRRRDGGSVYLAPDSMPYATDGRLTFEQRVVAASVERTEHVVHAGAALLALPAAADLAAEQRDAVISLLDSGLRLQALVGPAGAGKTTVLRHVARAWTETTGGRVVGLAPSQIAAEVLRAELDLPIRLSGGSLVANTARWVALAASRPLEWGLHAGDLVILDEAGMSSDTHLDLLLRAVTEAGARLVCVGDPAQLASPEAGAGYSLLTRQPGALELTEVRRFLAPWEAEASLQLRAGDPVSLDAYDKRGRIHRGTRAEVESAAWASWSADTAAGKQSLLVVTNDVDRAAMNERARAHRVGLEQVDDDQTLMLRDGTRVGAGDIIVTRRNDPFEGGGQAINRRTWTVRSIDRGGVLVAPIGEGPSGEVRLSAGYVGEHVELGYACLPHGTQGMTVDTTHLILGLSGTDRAGLYVPMSRGREENHVYVESRVVNQSGQTLKQGQALAILSRSLSRDTTQESATETAVRELEAPRVVSSLAVVLEDVAGRIIREDNLARLNQMLPPELIRRIVSDPAAPELFHRLGQLDLAGRPTEQLLRAAINERSFGDAQSVAQVLAWRLGDADNLQRISSPLEGSQHPLAPVAREAAQLLVERAAQLGAAASYELPDWALHLIGSAPDAAGAPRWIERASAVAAWREFAKVPTDEVTFGDRPRGPQWVGPALWTAANDAVVPREYRLDVRALSKGQLEELVAAAEEAVRQSPRFVDGPLWVAHVDVRRVEDQLGRDVELGTPASLQGEVSKKRAWLSSLEGHATARAEWRRSSEGVLELGSRAGAELARRGRSSATERPSPSATTQPTQLTPPVVIAPRGMRIR